MRTILASLTSLISASFFVNMSNAAITTMIGIYVAEIGGEQSDVALIAACYSVGFLAGCLLGPRHIHRIGYPRSFTAAAAVLTIAIVALDISDTPLVWAGLRMMMGFAVAVTTAVTDAWINDKSPNNQRGRIIAIYAIVLGIGSVASQMAFFFLDSGSNGFVLMFAIAMNFAVVLVALTSAAPPQVNAPAAALYAGLGSVSKAATVGAFSSGFARAAYISIVPFYLRTHGVEENLIALSLAMLYLGRLVFQWPVGLISDRFDRRTVLAILSLVVATITLMEVMPGKIGSTYLYEGRIFAGEAGAVMQVGAFLLVLLLGGALFPIYSVASSLAFDRAEGRSMIGISTSLLIAYSVGSIAGPLAVMVTDNLVGDSALGICILVVCVLTAVVSLYKRTTSEGPSEHIPSAAAVVPETSLEMAHVAAEQADESAEVAHARE
jgi:MFS family permease